MARSRIQIYADLPQDLARADELMNLYGTWATEGRRGVGRCGSAEGNYVAERGQALEDRREPKRPGLHIDDAVRCQRALTAVPDRERIVLAVIYVPRAIPAEQQLRLLRIPPQLSQQRHLLGLRMWWIRYRILGGE